MTELTEAEEQSVVAKVFERVLDEHKSELKDGQWVRIKVFTEKYGVVMCEIQYNEGIVEL